MTYRQAAGHRVVVYNSPESPRNMLRRHLRNERYQLKDLSVWWDVLPTTAYRLMNDKRRPLSPQYYELAIKHLKLDIHDAQLLLIAGAREAGWNIKPKDLL